MVEYVCLLSHMPWTEECFPVLSVADAILFLVISVVIVVVGVR